MPLTITTAPVIEGRERPYDDDIGPDNLLSYRYRGNNPQHRDNVGLRLAMRRQAPLIYMFGIVPGRYMPTYPVYIVGDDPATLTFTVAVDDRVVAIGEGRLRESADEARRRYITAVTQKRLHQEGFRTRVLLAYREHCAICRLRHVELLQAAHILPDTHPQGLPIVPNGLALCTLHHAAFDAHVIGIRPDYVVQVRRDVLEEEDGPMLEHGLQGFHGTSLYLPRSSDLRPNPEFLAERFKAFEAS
jgi:putative restriction endonuclease